MSSSVRLKFNRKAFYNLRSAPKVVDFLEAAGENLVSEANATLNEGVGYRMSSGQGRKRPQGRWAVRVFTSSNHAKNSNAIHNTLVRLLS
jgi:hypothetical protein